MPIISPTPISAIAQMVALDHGHRVDRLILACTTPGGAEAYPLPEATLTLIREAAGLPPEEATRRLTANESPPGGSPLPQTGRPAGPRGLAGAVGGLTRS
ncbi:hypothetical protein [Actinoallomurus sp. NPDC050550]|uniref:hypothetical protein n=1 Tax=Actinoallomurus sp. NPDC050550 TaxID=3154937 RepID=UPI0033FD1EAB